VKVRFDSKDGRQIVICLALFALSVFIGVRYFYRVFPEASIDFRLSREEAKEKAAAFLKAMGTGLAGHKYAGVFDHDDEAVVYLERTVGLEEANRLVAERVRVWRWENRWFLPRTKEELRVGISPGGELVRFRHTLDEGASGARLDPAEVRGLALGFLEKWKRLAEDDLRFIGQETRERPNRRDHTLTWELKRFRVGEATYRYEVGIAGGAVSAYREFLKIPESWLDGYKKLRSLNDLTALVADFFLALTLVAVIVCFILESLRRNVRWRTAILIGTVAFALFFLDRLNAFPLEKFAYDTRDSYAGFLTRFVLLDGLLLSFGAACYIFALTCAAEPLYRERFGNRLSLGNLFRLRGIRTKAFFHGVLLGYTLTAASFAYEVLFYLAADRLGAWAPADIPYSNMLNTRLPWVVVLLGGFFPAVNEEFLCRMFSIPFLERVFRLRGLAVVVPALVWGFAHANYPNQPFYIRGVEVGILGVVMGVVLLRRGILPLLVWHFTVDAFDTALLIFRSSNLYFVASAAIACGVMLIPLVVSLLLYWKTGGFEPETGLLNAAGEMRATRAPEGAAPAPPRIEYRGLSRGRILAGVAVVLVCTAVLWLPAEKVGGFIRYPITGSQAAKISDAFFREKAGVDQVDLKRFRTVVAPEDSSLAEDESKGDTLDIKYILSHGGVEKLNEIARTRLKAGLWRIRYFIPLSNEELTAQVDPRERTVFSFEHVLPEDAPAEAAGPAAISMNDARKVAESFLASMGVPVAALALRDARTEERPRRTDHEFVWACKTPVAGNAEERIGLGMQGNRVSAYRPFLKLDERWEREEEEWTLAHTVLYGFRILLFIAFFVAAGVIFVTQLKNRRIGWKKILALSAGPTVLVFLYKLNSFQTVFQEYDPATPLQVFVIQEVVVALLVVLFQGALIALALACVLGPHPGIGLLGKRKVRLLLARDALFGTPIAVMVAAALRRGTALAVERFPSLAVVEGFGVPDSLGGTLPFVTALYDVMKTVVFLWAVVAIGAVVYRWYIRRAVPGGIAGLVALAALVPDGARTSGELVFEYLVLFFWAVLILFLVGVFFRGNYLAFFLSGLAAAGIDSAVPLIRMGAPFYVANGLVVLVLSLLPFIYVAVESLRAGTGRAQRDEPIDSQEN
jgi:membrane protease YdiL (CAAX protease family)